jgi:hypothetical protein
MTKKFCMCIATVERTPEARRQFFATLRAAAAAVMATPVWTMRVHGTEMMQGAWSDEPIYLPKESVVCMYPRISSSRDGAWIVERVGDIDVWTLSLPIAVLNTRSGEVLDTLWSMGGISPPCLGGEEYSMAATRRLATDVLVEAAGAESLATHAVVQGVEALKDWAVLRKGGDRVLLARKCG